MTASTGSADAASGEPIAVNRTRRRLVLASVMIAMFMAAIEATIVATAMPSIVADLGGFSLFSWVFSIFLLTQAVTVPLYGKLADLYGRTPVFTFGVSVFLLGSLLCGLAPSMHWLIASRALQGAGAGAVLPIASTIVGDIYSFEERARVQGYLSSVWGISSIVGPLLGGIFVTYLHWSLVFWINLPIGVLAVLGIRRFLHEQVERRPHRLDIAGAVLLLLALSSLVVALVQGGVGWPWLSWPSLALLALAPIGLAAFVWRERSAAEPMVPALVWSRGVQRTSNVGSLLAMALMMGVTTFIPTYIQGVHGATATVAGFCLSGMSLGWPLASTLAGRLMVRIGLHRAALIGAAFLIAGSATLVELPGGGHGPLWAAAGAFLVGLGMGFTTTVYLVAVQSSVPWQQRGVATGFNMLMRILGGALGAAALGGVLNNRLASYLAAQPDWHAPAAGLEAVSQLIDPVVRDRLPDATVRLLREGVSSGLQSVYWVVLGISVLVLISALLFPRRGVVLGQGQSPAPAPPGDARSDQG
ncbi:MAG: MDR family MFS transporter [Pseudomonadota bacterium]